MAISKVLGIAPYEGMRNLMLQAAASMTDVKLTVYVGDLELGAEIAARYTAQEFDVILSRGGTAELIREKSRLPVVEIELTIYDILRSIRLAENSNSRYVIVGFPAITRSAHVLCDILQYDIKQYTIHNEEEARKTLKKLAAEGCQMVLCDMITNSLAHEYGIPALLITSGVESVVAALHHAVSTSRQFLAFRERSQLLEAILGAHSCDTVVVGEDGGEAFRTTRIPLPETVEKRIRATHCENMQEGSKRIAIAADKQQYLVDCQAIEVSEKRYAMFTIQPGNCRPSLEKSGIRYMNKEDVMDQFFNSFYGVTQSATSQAYDLYATSDSPLMVIGEEGTGINQMAQLIYGRGKYQNAPLCLIDCTLLQQKGWAHLMGSDNSPLTSLGITLHFQHIEDLTDEQYAQLFMTIHDTRFFQRNKLLFSCAVADQAALSQRYQQLLNWFGCIIMPLSPLREHKADIPHLASLYISLLNMRNAREVVGLEPEAMKRLESYDWPENYAQFKRILRELVFLAKGAYITGESVQHLLSRESKLHPQKTSRSLHEALQGKTMKEVEMLAIRQALEENDGNQSATAESLGISRTTLWRMLQAQDG